MATIVTLSGSPSRTSRTAGVLRQLGARLAADGHDVRHVDVRDLPPAPLLAADPTDPDLAAVLALLGSADGLVVATPIYKAAYTGVLKALLDLLPSGALAGTVVLPLASGGSLAHALALDYALRPVLAALGAPHVLPGVYLVDAQLAGAVPDPAAEAALLSAVDGLLAALSRSGLPRVR